MREKGDGGANNNIISSLGGSPIHVIHGQPNYDSVAATSYSHRLFRQIIYATTKYTDIIIYIIIISLNSHGKLHTVPCGSPPARYPSYCLRLYPRMLLIRPGALGLKDGRGNLPGEGAG